MQVTFICDHCDKPLRDNNGPLVVTVRSDEFPEMNRSGEFCTLDCFASWVKNYIEKAGA